MVMTTTTTTVIHYLTLVSINIRQGIREIIQIKTRPSLAPLVQETNSAFVQIYKGMMSWWMKEHDAVPSELIQRFALCKTSIRKQSLLNVP